MYSTYIMVSKIRYTLTMSWFENYRSRLSEVKILKLFPWFDFVLTSSAVEM